MTLSGNPASALQAATKQYVDSAASGSFPAGGIIMWNGSVGSIPSGWVLCNGSNGTPDLRDRFVVGAGSTYAVGATGGSADTTLVSHSHTFSATTSGVGDHTHSLFGSSTGTTGTGAFENRVPSGSRTSKSLRTSTGLQRSHREQVLMRSRGTPQTSLTISSPLTNSSPVDSVRHPPLALPTRLAHLSMR